MAFSDWSTTAASNTSIGGISIQGTNVVKNFDNALREMMAQLKAGVPAKVSTTTDNALARFDGTSGQMQGSTVVVTDAGAMSGITSLAINGALTGVTDITISGAANFGSLKIGEASFVTDAPLEASSTSGLAAGFEFKGASGGGGLGVNRTSSDGSAIIFYRAASLVGSISVTASATAYNTSSDYRIKDEVEPYAGGLAAIQALQPCTFVMKADPDRIRQLGFIAHEVQAVLPQAVTGEKDAVDENGDIITQQLDLSKIVPALVSSVQELAAEVAELRNQISSL